MLKSVNDQPGPSSQIRKADKTITGPVQANVFGLQKLHPILNHTNRHS